MQSLAALVSSSTISSSISSSSVSSSSVSNSSSSSQLHLRVALACRLHRLLHQCCRSQPAEQSLCSRRRPQRAHLTQRPFDKLLVEVDRLKPRVQNNCQWMLALLSYPLGVHNLQPIILQAI